MRKFYFVISVFFALFCFLSCAPQNEPTDPDNDDYNDTWSDSGNEVLDPPVASFSVSKQQPLTIVLTNKSRNAVSYKWNFGDGNTSTEKNPVHKYGSKGVYRVKLYAYNSDYKYDMYESNVTVENPSKIYFAGITYEKLSVNNKYVHFELLDDDIFTTTWCTSTAKLLSTANLPYDFILQNPVLMDGLEDDEWYAIQLYSSDTPDDEGTKLAGFRFDTDELLDGYPEGFTWNENEGCKISCYFTYE